MKPAFFKPMNVIKTPMPVAVAILNSEGIAFAIVSLNRRDRDDQEQHTGPEDDAECGLPPDSLRENDRERKKGVDTHPGRDGERKFCIDAHHERHDKTDQNGSG